MNELTKPKNNWLHWLGLAAFIFLLTIAWFVFAVCQLIIPAYIPLYAYFLYTLLFSLILLPFTLTGKFRHTKATTQLIFVLDSVLIWFYPVSSRQLFLRDLTSVQLGMTVTEVDAIMEKYMKGTGWPTNPYSNSPSPKTLTNVGNGSTHQIKANNKGEREIAGAITYRHSNEAEYNSDWGVISFKNGRVVKVEFMPD